MRRVTPPEPAAAKARGGNGRSGAHGRFSPSIPPARASAARSSPGAGGFKDAGSAFPWILFRTIGIITPDLAAREKRMKRRSGLLGGWLFLLVGFNALAASPLLFDRQEYAARRGRLMEKIADGIADHSSARRLPPPTGPFGRAMILPISRESGFPMPSSSSTAPGRRASCSSPWARKRRRGRVSRSSLSGAPKRPRGSTGFCRPSSSARS